jgi:negative regulator of replication initiation
MNTSLFSSASDIIQSLFYVTAAVIAVLTYTKAKKHLLSPVNAEIHKKIIDRLNEASQELFFEFDPTSEDHWWKTDHFEQCVSQIFERSLEIAKINDGQERYGGLPLSETQIKLFHLKARYSHDPFVPSHIRNEICEYASSRIEAINRSHEEGMRKAIELAKRNAGKTFNIENRKGAIHNAINQSLYESGFGISQVEDSVNSIRDAIGSYLSKFNPLQ